MLSLITCHVYPGQLTTSFAIPPPFRCHCMQKRFALAADLSMADPSACGRSSRTAAPAPPTPGHTGRRVTHEPPKTAWTVLLEIDTTQLGIAKLFTSATFGASSSALAIYAWATSCFTL
eukprot:4374956-Amphidinium_carterae.1